MTDDDLNIIKSFLLKKRNENWPKCICRVRSQGSSKCISASQSSRQRRWSQCPPLFLIDIVIIKGQYRLMSQDHDDADATTAGNLFFVVWWTWISPFKRRDLSVISTREGSSIAAAALFDHISLLLLAPSPTWDYCQCMLRLVLFSEILVKTVPLSSSRFAAAARSFQ